jgi:hypothetical protein
VALRARLRPSGKPRLGWRAARPRHGSAAHHGRQPDSNRYPPGRRRRSARADVHRSPYVLPLLLEPRAAPRASGRTGPVGESSGGRVFGPAEAPRRRERPLSRLLKTGSEAPAAGFVRHQQSEGRASGGRFSGSAAAGAFARENAGAVSLAGAGSPPASASASARVLAQNLQAPGARVWRGAGKSPQRPSALVQCPHECPAGTLGLPAPVGGSVTRQSSYGGHCWAGALVCSQIA